MPRPIWNGSISFGLVNVPVGLYTATQDHSIRFHQFQSGTSDRINLRRVNERTGEEVAYQDIVKGADLGDEEYVLLDRSELEGLAPTRSKTIDISDFVDLEDIDPAFFRSNYYLAPANKSSEKAYRLLLQAMDESGKVGVSSFVMRNKEYLCVVRAGRGVIMLETLYFSDEIRDPAEILDDTEEHEEPTERELAIARQLVDSLSAPWEPDRYQDTYRDEVSALIEQKRQGQVVTRESAEVTLAPVVDLMAALQASIEQASSGSATDGESDRRPAGGASARTSATPRTRRSSAEPAAKSPARPPAKKSAPGSGQPDTAGKGKATPAARGPKTRSGEAAKSDTDQPATEVTPAKRRAS